MPARYSFSVLFVATIAVDHASCFMPGVASQLRRASNLDSFHARASRFQSRVCPAVMEAESPKQACDTVRAMYAAFNRRDFNDLLSHFDEEVVYRNCNFARPFEGKEAVRKLFSETFDKLPSDFTYELEDMTEGDDLRVGVQWHLAVGDKLFPGSEGCSFYRLDPESGKIVYARTVVEPVLKPENNLLPMLDAVSAMVRNGIYR